MGKALPLDMFIMSAALTYGTKWIFYKTAKAHTEDEATPQKDTNHQPAGTENIITGPGRIYLTGEIELSESGIVSIRIWRLGGDTVNKSSTLG